MHFSNSPIVSSVLVGREPEMALLEQALSAATGGTGQCVLVAGEAGVGKSRLIAELRAGAAARSFLSLRGYCFEQDASFPYAPLADALRTHFATYAPREALDLLGPLAPVLLKLLPHLALQSHELAPPPALEPEAERRRLFEALAQFVTGLAAARPVLFVVEDIHWSDDTSLDFLHFIARRLSAWPVLLLASYRREEASPRLIHLLAQLERAHLAREIALVPLTRDQVDAMLREIFELAQPVKPEFLDLIYTLTDGNPFFIEEVLKGLLESGEIFFSDTGWERKPIQELHVPRSVQDAVWQRAGQVTESAQQVLKLAAVVGRRFEFTLLQALTATTEDELLQHIKQLLSAQLVVEVSADEYAFRHALTREAVYATLLKRERKALHLVVAETLERLYADAMRLEAHLADLAYHFYESGAWAKAFEYSQRAGERARSLYAPYEAIGHFTRALEAARQLGRQPDPQLHGARGKAYETIGDFENAVADLKTALELAQASAPGDRGAEWQALLDLGFLWASRDYSQTGDYFQKALDLAQEMGDPATLAHSLNRLGNWYLNVEQAQEALRCHQQALSIFQGLNERPGLAETFDLLGMASVLSCDLIGATHYYDQAVALFRELDNRPSLASSLGSLTLRAATFQTSLMVPAAPLPEAAREGEMALQIARDIGQRAGEAYALVFLGFCLAPSGEYRRALESARRGLEIAQEIEHRQWMTAAHCALGAIHHDLLALAEARPHLEQALTLAMETGSLHWIHCATGYLASLCTAQNELDRATAILDSSLPADSPSQTLGQRLAWCARAEHALARGDAEVALQIADQLIASTPNLSQAGAIPRLARLRAEAQFQLGKVAQAGAELQAAQEAAHVQGSQSLLWRIQIALGRVYQVQERHAEARQAFAAASTLVEELAAKIPDDSLRANFVRRAMAMLPPGAKTHGERPETPRQAAKREYGGLTPRECEVAALVGQGKSNREIANDLVLSERTVEHHVTNILSKLGLNSRAQVAVWAVEKGLADAEA